MICHTIFEEGDHCWLAFGQDSEKPVSLVDTNQIVILSGDSATLLDPGGLEIFPSFLSALTERVAIDKIDHIFFSHQDPDISSSLPLWRQVCKPGINFYVSELWTKFLTHFDAGAAFTPIPDKGMDLTVGDGLSLQLIPAHYLHSPGNFSVYDPIARILFSGEIGTALMPPGAANGFNVTNFDKHIQFMEGFHQRWMAARQARDAWIASVVPMEIDALVPQHGLIFKGETVQGFLDWFSALDIGTGVEAIYVGAARPAASAPVLAQDSADIFSEVLGESVKDGMPRGEPEPGKEYRLVTRSDFDGLVCAVLLEELDMIDDILFVHPNDMQEGRVDITDNDITTNLPYVPGCHLAFDHHLSEIRRLDKKYDNHINIPEASSAARVVYEYYDGLQGFPNVSPDLMEAVDKGDSAQFSMEEVLNPTGWPLLNFIMDPRTGLGRFRGFRIPNYELMMELIELCRHKDIQEILEEPDFKERVELYLEQAEPFKDQIQRCSTVHGKIVVFNLLEEDIIYVGNRFMIYALFPHCNISIHEMWGRDKQNVVFAVGKSIFDKSSRTNVGELMLQYGGGGHSAAGTCHSEPILAETVKTALIHKINEDSELFLLG